MASPTKRSRTHLQHLTTNFHNRSFSSITSQSDAGTFHSALAHPSHMELRPMSQSNASRTVVKRPTSPLIPQPLPSPQLESVKMNRQDSGFASGSTHSPRTSTSSISRRSSPSKRDGPRRRSTNNSISSRPTTKRASKSSTTALQRSSSSTNRRPSLQNRHTVPYHNQPTYQFFHFPTLNDSESSDPHSQLAEEERIPAPPATIQYWTSDNTRRLEYAAIDAASRGVKGFFIKLVPDCILPPSSRRPRFSDGDADDDLGSVRRYRLDLPEEKSAHARASRGGLWRRFSWGRGARRGSC